MNGHIRVLILCLTLGYSVHVIAEGIVINLGTIHTADARTDSGKKTTYNNLNLGIGYETTQGYELGVFRNSHYENSFYALKRQSLFDEWGINYSLGLVTGYNDTALPLVTIDKVFYKNFRLLATATPIRAHSISDGFQLVIGLQLVNF